jgi:hypothetical protein
MTKQVKIDLDNEFQIVFGHAFYRCAIIFLSSHWVFIEVKTMMPAFNSSSAEGQADSLSTANAVESI